MFVICWIFTWCFSWNMSHSDDDSEREVSILLLKKCSASLHLQFTNSVRVFGGNNMLFKFRSFVNKMPAPHCVFFTSHTLLKLSPKMSQRFRPRFLIIQTKTFPWIFCLYAIQFREDVTTARQSETDVRHLDGLVRNAAPGPSSDIWQVRINLIFHLCTKLSRKVVFPVEFLLHLVAPNTVNSWFLLFVFHTKQYFLFT